MESKNHDDVVSCFLEKERGKDDLVRFCFIILGIGLLGGGFAAGAGFLVFGFLIVIVDMIFRLSNRRK